MRAIERVLLSIVIGLLSFPSPLPSADFRVSDVAGLEAALAAAEGNGEEDAIVLAAGTYVGNFEYLPGSSESYSLSIRGHANAECLWQKKIPAGTYDVRLALPKEEPIAMGTFSVREPTISGVTPEHDVPGAILSIAGSFFTSKRPKVYLRNPITSADTKCKVVTWLMDATTGEGSLDCVVPELPPGDYQVILETRIGAGTWGGTFAVDAVIP
jgi:hypothetical protein